MRRKISKRQRKELWRLGGIIDEEYWVRNPDTGKRACYVVKGRFYDSKIVAIDFDELAAYEAFMECMVSYLEGTLKMEEV